MPEAKLLFGVTALVILGLVAWVVAVLRAPREPWAREYVMPQPVPVEEPPLVGEAPAEPPVEKGAEAEPRSREG